jgi:hypothetical protein
MIVTVAEDVMCLALRQSEDLHCISESVRAGKSGADAKTPNMKVESDRPTNPASDRDFMEVTKRIVGDEVNQAIEMMDDVNTIVDRYGATCYECEQIDENQVPFSDPELW